MLLWALVIGYSLTPFHFATLTRATSDREPVGIELTSLLAHFVAFMALGALDALRNPQPRRSSRSSIATGLGLCGAIEFLQLFLPARHPEVLDLAVNAAGLISGHVAVTAGTGEILRLRPPHLAPSAFVVGFIYATIWGSVFILSGHSTSLRGWDPSYPLLIGNESDGQRPWTGQVQFVALYDVALDIPRIRTLAERPAGSAAALVEREGMGLVAAYDFTRGRPIERRFGDNQVPLSLRLPRNPAERRQGASTLVIDDGHTAGTSGPVAEINGSIAASSAFSVEVWFRPDAMEQTGPARIIGISDGIWRRNFTLGQEGHGLTFRVRNRLNGPNGSRYELHASDALLPEPQQVIATYRRGVSTLFRNGQQLKSTDLGEPSVLLGLGTARGSRMITALLAALSLVMFASVVAPDLSFTRLLLIGYASLALVPAVALLYDIPPATSLLAWFGPALAVAWLSNLALRQFGY